MRSLTRIVFIVSAVAGLAVLILILFTYDRPVRIDADVIAHSELLRAIGRRVVTELIAADNNEAIGSAEVERLVKGIEFADYGNVDNTTIVMILPCSDQFAVAMKSKNLGPTVLLVSDNGDSNTQLIGVYCDRSSRSLSTNALLNSNRCIVFLVRSGIVSDTRLLSLSDFQVNAK